MQFIKKVKEEEEICLNSLVGKRENSKQINYLNKVNDKPWGKEYLAYQNRQIGIWILHVNKDQETSLHCHFKKDTILLPLYGCFRINLYNSFHILNLFESLYLPRNTFHGIHSYVDDGILMEIEIYTEHIEYTDKNDLLRIRDIYNRDKNRYETSVKEREPEEKETMEFRHPNRYFINKTEISILKIQDLDEIKESEKIILLEGSLYSDGKRITSGSFLDLTKEHSFLTDSIDVLCLSNLDHQYLKKIIYSKNHLKDFMEKMCSSNSTIQNTQCFEQPKIGLTCGCFDILHEGHIRNLKMCKKKCDYLLVCLSSDEQIRRLKGEKRPINHLIDRVSMLMNFDFIDFIILYDEIDDRLEIELDHIMNIVKPDIWFKGNDYKKEEIIEKHPSLKEILLIDFVEGKSTTNIIKKILY
jgi:D-beta-D-heptose 7-phosphate kinase/D-beta-D-heptose 1-phosphate adenosyltransferase